jgi:hypothetical protein
VKQQERSIAEPNVRGVGEYCQICLCGKTITNQEVAIAMHEENFYASVGDRADGITNFP